MGHVTQDSWDAHYGEGRSFRPLDDAEVTLLRALVPAPPGGGQALDVGCGLGELARHLAAAGYTVDALDHASSHVLNVVWPGLLPDLPPVHRYPLA
ncbi:hypothetical protein [Streptomyces platensis]|uniref:hypothetical protein n=1 Tax=Streptomyces platensis TaxID=58346 RepID=UPI002E25328B